MAETTKKASAPKQAATKTTKIGAVSAKAKKAEPKKAAVKITSTITPVKKAAPRKITESRAPVKKSVSDEQRYRMIAEAAYFRAESRNFQSDHVRDWIDAERDIAILLGESK